MSIEQSLLQSTRNPLVFILIQYSQRYNRTKAHDRTLAPNKSSFHHFLTLSIIIELAWYNLAGICESASAATQESLNGRQYQVNHGRKWTRHICTYMGLSHGVEDFINISLKADTHDPNPSDFPAQGSGRKEGTMCQKGWVAPDME